MKEKVFRVIWLILAILCAIYSVIIYLVGSGTNSFIIWIAGTLVFLLLFFLAGKGRWKRVPKGLRIAS